MSRQTIFSFGLFLLLGLLILWATTQLVPLNDQAPLICEQLDDAKTACESRAQQLKQLGIDGENEYRKAQKDTNACIDYLLSVLDEGRGEKNQIERRLRHTADSCNYFCRWSNEQFQENGGTALEVKIDFSDVLADVMSQLDEGQPGESAKNALNSYRFLSWDDVP